MNKSEVIIFGTGKIAQLLHATLADDTQTPLKVAGFCLDSDYFETDNFSGLPVVRFDDAPKVFPPHKYKMLVALGYHQMNAVRAARCSAAAALGYELPGYIHPDASVSKAARIGQNCLIMDKVSVAPFAVIGDNVSLYPNSTVAHHAQVGDNVWVTSGTVVGGNSKIGNNCFLGLNCTIGHNVEIGERNFIGAGAVVTKCTSDNEVHVLADTPKHRLNTDQFLKLFKFD